VGTAAAADAIRRATRDADLDIVVGRTREVLADSHVAIAVSGTVTMEVAYFGVPMVVFYRTGSLLRALYRLLGRWVVRTPHFSLVNILAGRRAVPELMPWHGSKRVLIHLVMDVMEDLGYLFEARKTLIELLDPLRSAMTRRASDATADLICRSLAARR